MFRRDFAEVVFSRPNVEFCGYNVPHPLEDKIVVRVQTQNGVPAAKVFVEALGQLETVFASIRKKFINATDEFHSS